LLSAEKKEDQHWLCKRVAHFQGRKVQGLRTQLIIIIKILHRMLEQFYYMQKHKSLYDENKNTAWL
jgi:hypothetical protein